MGAAPAKPRHWLAEGAGTLSLASPFACALLPLRWPLSVPGASGFALETILAALAQWPERGHGPPLTETMVGNAAKSVSDFYR